MKSWLDRFALCLRILKRRTDENFDFYTAIQIGHVFDGGYLRWQILFLHAATSGRGRCANC
jgi:hypothetical protein